MVATVVTNYAAV